MSSSEQSEFESIVGDLEFEDPFKEYRLEIRRTILALTEAATWLGALDMEMDEEHEYTPLDPEAFEYMSSIVHDAHMLCEIISDAAICDCGECDIDEDDD